MGRVAILQPAPTPGGCLSLCKNALLSPIKYASPTLNFNGLLRGVTFFTSWDE